MNKLKEWISELNYQHIIIACPKCNYEWNTLYITENGIVKEKTECYCENNEIIHPPKYLLCVLDSKYLEILYFLESNKTRINCYELNIYSLEFDKIVSIDDIEDYLLFA